MTKRDFGFLRQFVFQYAGISLGPGKNSLVYSRVVRRVRALGLPSFSAYCDLVRQVAHPERQLLIEVLTTNHTRFFREESQLEHLFSFASEWRKIHANDRRIRIWSAGCASGEEAYTLAITAIRAGLTGTGWDTKVLATDISERALEVGRRGEYSKKSVDLVPEDLRQRFFNSAKEIGPEAPFQVRKILADLVHFRHLNLKQSQWPMAGPFDIIFCRNVLMYFESNLQEAIVRRFTSLLAPHGVLVLGHADAVGGAMPNLVAVGHHAYRRGADE